MANFVIFALLLVCALGRVVGSTANSVAGGKVNRATTKPTTKPRVTSTTASTKPTTKPRVTSTTASTTTTQNNDAHDDYYMNDPALCHGAQTATNIDHFLKPGENIFIKAYRNDGPQANFIGCALTISTLEASGMSFKFENSSRNYINIPGVTLKIYEGINVDGNRKALYNYRTKENFPTSYIYIQSSHVTVQLYLPSASAKVNYNFTLHIQNGDEAETERPGLGWGAIAAIVLGIILGLEILAVLCYGLYKITKKNGELRENQNGNTQAPDDQFQAEVNESTPLTSTSRTWFNRLVCRWLPWWMNGSS